MVGVNVNNSHIFSAPVLLLEYMDLSCKIEGVLFYKGNPVTKSALAVLFDAPEAEIETALSTLQESLSNRGLALVSTTTEVQLVTDPKLDTFIEDIRRDELKRDIGKAGAETLAIILYKEPVTRAEIDRIRGVNSSFILRNLLTRGLITKVEGARGTAYSTSTALLMHLGVQNKSSLPQYASVLDTLEQFEAEAAESDT